MNILIGGDTIATSTNERLFINGEVEKLFGEEIINEFKNSDFNIVNLETPLAIEKSPILKNGPNFICNPSILNSFTKLGINAVALANNHILDQGINGLVSTVNALDNNNILRVGAGIKNYDINRHLLIKDGEKTTGFYNCCENEFSVVKGAKFGANGYDALKTFDDIKRVKDSCDLLIVIFHGGKEEYQYPSPKLQEICRKMIISGADFVICQHSHCIGCEEKYNNKTILYGQGNFIMDFENVSDLYQTSMLLRINTNSNSIEYIPLIKKGSSVRMASNEEKRLILKEFNDRSKDIKKTGFVEKQYEELGNKMLNDYLYSISGRKPIIFKIANKITNGKFKNMYIKIKYKQNELSKVLNYFECEAHNELIINSLKKRIKN